MGRREDCPGHSSPIREGKEFADDFIQWLVEKEARDTLSGLVTRGGAS